MNKADLISKIAVNSGLSKGQRKALAATIDAIVDSLKEGKKFSSSALHLDVKSAPPARDGIENKGSHQNSCFENTSVQSRQST